ncbi:MAG: SpoIIE family protein phosphatase [Bernardetiaceae bacterium]
MTKWWLTCGLVCLSLVSAWGQQYIRGRVVLPSGDPVAGALVRITADQQVISDGKGTFRLRFDSDQSFETLTASKDDHTFDSFEFRDELLVIVMRYTPKSSAYPVMYYVRGRVVDHLGQGVSGLRVSFPESNTTKPSITDESGYFSIQLARERKVSTDMVFLINNERIAGEYMELRPDANSVLIRMPKGGFEQLSRPPTEAEKKESAFVQVQVVDSSRTTPLTSYVIVYGGDVYKTNKSGYFNIPLESLSGKDSVNPNAFNFNAGDTLADLIRLGDKRWKLVVESILGDLLVERDTSSANDVAKYYNLQINQTLDIIEDEKKQLAVNGARISAKIERLAAQLRDTDAMTPEQVQQLRLEINRLRTALRENETAFAKAQERTRELLRQVNNMMQETEEELERTSAERAAFQRRLLLVSSLVVFFGLIAFFFYRNARRIQRQKNDLERVNRNMDLLGKIGRNLTSKLSISAISQEVYQDVNALMDASIFALGVHEPEQRRLFFPASIENGEKLPPYYYDDTSEQALLSVRALQNREEIIIQNFEKEAPKYLNIDPSQTQQALPLSVVYLPLIANEKPIGVLTVQSYEREAYSDYQLSILRNLAVYVGIAIQNAKVYEEIASQNRKITDSITYAKRIQASIFPSQTDMQAAFKDHLIFYLPRDIVSGDFYYFHQYPDGQTLVALIDCTGHGVPGGFMSLIGYQLLNDLTAQQKLDDPAQILNQMHEGVVRILHQDTGASAQDGMEVTLCVFAADRRSVAVSSCHMPLMIFNPKRPEGLLEVKGDRLSVGGMYYTKRESFVCHRIPLLEGDRLYFFSDGLQDQFGGPNNRKFLKKRLRQLLTHIQEQPNMTAQKAAIQTAFSDWKGHYPQVDDILLIGVEV